MKRFVLIGPESTGKSTLGQLLAKEFKTTLVPEYLRFYFEKYGIAENQMEYVAKQQMLSEQIQTTQDFILLDTNIISLKVYHKYYYKNEPDWFLKLYNPRLYDHYFLMDTSIPWVYDEQRESPEIREILYKEFYEELLNLNVAFTRITGNYEQRYLQAKSKIKELLI